MARKQTINCKMQEKNPTVLQIQVVLDLNSFSFLLYEQKQTIMVVLCVPASLSSEVLQPPLIRYSGSGWFYLCVCMTHVYNYILLHCHRELRLMLVISLLHKYVYKSFIYCVGSKILLNLCLCFLLFNVI